MKVFHSYKITILSLCSFFVLSSCSKEIESQLFENSSLVNVKLQAAESTFTKVNVDIQEVQFQVLEDGNDPEAWISLNMLNSGTVEMTPYDSNQIAVLVDFDEVPSEYIYSIRLVYGHQNSAVKNGITYNLDMSPNSDYDSINLVGKQLVTNKLYEFLVELDVDRSISVTNTGEAELDPKTNTVLRLFNLF